MNRLIPLLFFLFTALGLQAQSFSAAQMSVIRSGTADEELSPQVSLENHNRSPLRLAWRIETVDIPDNWARSFCDIDCHTALETSGFFTLPNQGTDLRLNFRPNGRPGFGRIEVVIYEPQDSTRTAVRLVFNASAQRLVTTRSFANTSASVMIYPNPATEYIRIDDEQGQVKRLDIFNLLGKKVTSYEVQGESEKYNVSRLQKGVYLVRMIDGNGKVLRTQRINKYNP